MWTCPLEHRNMQSFDWLNGAKPGSSAVDEVARPCRGVALVIQALWQRCDLMYALFYRGDIELTDQHIVDDHDPIDRIGNNGQKECEEKPGQAYVNR